MINLLLLTSFPMKWISLMHISCKEIKNHLYSAESQAPPVNPALKFDLRGCFIKNDEVEHFARVYYILLYHKQYASPLIVTFTLLYFASNYTFSSALMYTRYHAGGSLFFSRQIGVQKSAVLVVIRTVTRCFIPAQTTLLTTPYSSFQYHCFFKYEPSSYTRHQMVPTGLYTV